MLTNLTNLVIHSLLQSKANEDPTPDPAQNPSLLFWYDLNDSSTRLTFSNNQVTTNNTAVYKILDKSGNNHTLFNMTGSSLSGPTHNLLKLNTFNGMATIETTGSGSQCGFFTTTSPPMNMGLTFFCVYQSLGGASGFGALISKGNSNSPGPIDTYKTQRLIGSNGGINFLTVNTNLGTSISGPQLINCNWGPLGIYRERINSNLTNRILYTSLNHADSTSNALYIGTRADRYTYGYHRIGEMIGYNGPITINLRQKIEGYLMHKWGLASSLPSEHPFKNDPPANFSPLIG